MKFVNQREFAKLAGVASSTVSNAVNSGELRKAYENGRIDVEHPAALQYIQDRIKNHYMRAAPQRNGVNTKQKHRERLDEVFQGQATEERFQQKINEMSQDIKGLLNYTLGELIYYFGDDFRFLEWLKSIKEMETIETKRIKNEVMRGELVRRDLVHVGIFMTIDATFRQILGDASKSIANKTEAMVKSGSEHDKIVEQIRDVLGSFLSGCVQKMERCMRDI